MAFVCLCHGERKFWHCDKGTGCSFDDHDVEIEEVVNWFWKNQISFASKRTAATKSSGPFWLKRSARGSLSELLNRRMPEKVWYACRWRALWSTSFPENFTFPFHPIDILQRVQRVSVCADIFPHFCLYPLEDTTWFLTSLPACSLRSHHSATSLLLPSHLRLCCQLCSVFCPVAPGIPDGCSQH